MPRLLPTTHFGNAFATKQGTPKISMKMRNILINMPDFSMIYTQQTGRTFKIRYQKQLRGSNATTINQN